MPIVEVALGACIIVAVLLGLWLGRLMGERVLRPELKAQLEKVEELKAEKERLEGLTKSQAQECQQFREQIARSNEREIAQEQKYTQMKADVDKAFADLASKALRDNNESFLRLAKNELGGQAREAKSDLEAKELAIKNLIDPLGNALSNFEERTREIEKVRERAEALLNNQVQRLANASESLTNALRKPVIRGSWGENMLENALESAGLEPELEFILQHTTDAEDGQQRTDAVVNLPKGRKLIIDSKNLMGTYLPFSMATDENARSLAAEAHSKALKRHMKSLSAKEYWRRYEGLDCVILFIPHDGMYHAAIQDESELIRESSEKRVFISNPMTLIPLLKAIRYVLDQEKLNKNAEEIKNVGTELYTELTRYAGNVSNIGAKLRETVEAYNAAIPGLDRFIISKSRKLKQLGSAKGADAELPDLIEDEPRAFSSRELKFPSQIALAAQAEVTDETI